MNNYDEELLYEKNNLKKTKEWIKSEISLISENESVIKDKIALLKKSSRGSYNEELETTEKLYEIISKNLKNYTEASKEPYFARIDFREYRKEKESYYIGKFSLGDSSTGDEIVIDWRAPIADLYYSGTEGEAYYSAPIGVVNGELSLKRKFLYEDSKLKDIFDEGINDIILQSASMDSGENALIDEFLKINLEKNTGSKLKDIVATIQKEQNSIIRAEKSFPIIVQGSAGSGKTTVALHRLAYLLYRYRKKISGEDILVLAPNELFLDYISEVLPNLGVDKVKQMTFEEMAKKMLKIKGKVISKDKKLSLILEDENTQSIKYIVNSSKVKSTMVFKTMLDRYLKLIETRYSDIKDIKVEDYILFDTKEIKRLYLKDMVNLPINKRKEEIKRYLSLKLNDKLNEVLDKLDFYYEYTVARLKKTMEDSEDRRKKLIEIYDERDEKKNYIRSQGKKEFEKYFKEWSSFDIKELYMNLFNDIDIFYEVTSHKIPEPLYEYMKNELIENNDKGIIDLDDLAAMLYLKFNIEGVPEKYKFSHIVIDEAQDYSLFQMNLLRYMSNGDSFTIVGDLGQGIYDYKGIKSWEELNEKVFSGEAFYVPLTQSYRSTIEIINFANSVLKKQDNSLKPAKPVLRHGKKPIVESFKDSKTFCDKVDDAVEEVYKLGKKSIAIICKTHKECKKVYDIMKKYSNFSWKLVKENDDAINLDNIIIPSYMTKGLEFDCSIIYDCSDKNYSQKEIDKKLLYVVLTRALHLEYVFYNEEISPLLRE